MDQLNLQIKRAQQRLLFEQGLNRWVICLFIALLCAVVGIAIPKLVVIENLPANWNLYWAGGAVAVSLVALLVWSLISRRTHLEAAVELDERFNLRARVASSLLLSEKEQASEVGQALTKDAVRAVSQLDIGSQFSIQLKRYSWLPLIPALLVFAITFVSNQEAVSKPIPPENKVTIKKQIKKSAKDLEKKAAELKKEAVAKGLKKTAELFTKLEKATKKISSNNKLDKKKTLIKLNDIARELEKRRKKMGTSKEAMRKQMQGMKNLEKGPADKMVDEMKKGNFKKAIQEMKKLQDKLAKKNGLTKAEQNQLRKQLEQMAQKMEQEAQKQQQAIDRLQKQIEQAKKNGNLNKAGQLQKQLQKMQQQQSQMNQMKKMAQQMKQCAQCMKQGNKAGAAKAMAQMQQQMQQMQQQMDAIKMMKAMQMQLQQAKNQMNCKACNGGGCTACKNKKRRSNRAMGKGKGGAPGSFEEEDKTTFRDSNSPMNVRKGQAVIVGFKNGINRKGAVRASISAEMSSNYSQPADPLTSENLPRNYREMAEDYFRILRDGA